MSLNISDPLSLLAYQSGLADPPLVEAAAQAADDLTAQQRAYKIGDPVPIVFCRRVSGNGGVMVSPGATEARYQNDGTTNALTVSTMVVLSEGELPQIDLADCFIGPCRQGTWNQTYDRRAGTWTPGNFVTTVAGKDPWACPYYCGTSGRYEDMTTMSCVNTFVDGSERWNHQLHVFVREGIQITRIIDSTLGPSNNVIDLALYLMDKSGRIPSTLIDTTQMLAAANFTETNGLHFNGVFQESMNLDEWLEQISNDYLLRLVELNGKFGFRPRLPVNGDHTIKTTAISWDYTFTEDHLLPDGFEIQYIPLADRIPVSLQMMWRQQPESDIGFPRTTEISYSGEATAGPFEQYDLSGYCTSETHAVKVGAYRLARRKFITHTLRLKVRPANYNSLLTQGDIVRVRLRRETALAALDYHDFLYEIERIEKTASGACVFDLTHFPIDAQGRSMVALEVAAATAPGVVIASGRSNYSCDDNSSTLGIEVGIEDLPFPAFGYTPGLDDTIVDLDPPVDDEWAVGGDSPIGPDVSQPVDELIGGQTPIGGWSNPADPLEQSRDQDGIGYITGGTGPGGAPQVGDTLSVNSGVAGCSDPQVCWSKIDKNTNEEFDIECQSDAGGGTLSITTNELDHYIVVDARCKDPSTPDGWGAPQRLGQTEAVAMAPFFWEIAWAKALYEETASAQLGENYCTVFTYTYQDNRFNFASNGGASGSVAPGLIWLEQDIFTWDKPNYDCPYPPGSGVWYQLKPELPDGTVFPTESYLIGTPRATGGSSSMRFVWWETGVAVGYGDTLEEAQANASAQLP
jgi:hypothetical protein